MNNKPMLSVERESYPERRKKETNAARDLALSSLSYDPDSGEFRWLSEGKNTRGIGTIAGYLHPSGYRYIKIGQVRFSCQRLAWLFHTGGWPKENMDHINMIRSDNRIVNLREATNSQNNFNSPMKPNNTSGFKGVSRSARDGKYKAQISAHGKRILIGVFNDAESAAKAYDAEALRLHGEYARLNVVKP